MIQLRDANWTVSDVLVADLLDTRGGVLINGRSVLDLRNLPAGEYYLRVFATDQTARQFTVDFDAPVRGYEGSTTLPDRDVIDGGDGDDTIYGNNDIDRILGGSGADQIYSEAIEFRDGGVGDVGSTMKTEELISQDQPIAVDPEVDFPVSTLTLSEDAFPGGSLNSAIWDTGASTADVISNAARLNSGQQLQSLPIDFPDADRALISYSYKRNTAGLATLTVEYQQGGTWILLEEFVVEDVSVFLTHTLAFPAPVSASAIRFRSANNQVLIDDVLIQGVSARLQRTVAVALGIPVTTERSTGLPLVHGPLPASEVASLTSLNAMGLGLHSIDGIRQLTHLRSLDLRNNPALADLNLLADLHDLEDLHLEGTAFNWLTADAALQRRLAALKSLTLPITGLVAGQNLIVNEGTGVSLSTTASGSWTVVDSQNTQVAVGTGTTITFTPGGPGTFVVTHAATGAFPVYARNTAPVISGLPTTINLNEGDSRTVDQLLTGVTITDLGTAAPRRQVTVTDPAGNVTDLTVGSLQLNTNVIQLDSAILDGAADVTIGFWVHVDSARFIQAVLKAGDALSIEVTPAAVQVSTPGGNLSLPVSLNNGWHHLSIVRQEATNVATVFVDGAAAGQGTATRGLFTVPPGSFVVRGGQLDELAIWRRALSVAQVQDLHVNGVAGLQADLAAWYAMNETGGAVVYDRSTNRRNGVVTSARGSLQMNDDTVVLDSAILNGATDLTVSLWMQTTATGIRGILSGANSGNDNEFLITPHGSQTDTLRIYTGETNGSYVLVTLDTDFNDENWHHLAVIRNDAADTISVYFDGQPQGSPVSTTLSALTVDAGGLVIGQEQDLAAGNFAYDPAQAFRGGISDVGIWRRVLSENEVVTVYHEGIDASDAGLAAWFPLNDLAGTVARDLSPNARHATASSPDATPLNWSTESPVFEFATDAPLPAVTWSPDSGIAALPFVAIDEGDYALEVTAIDQDGAFDQAVASIHVLNIAPTAVVTLNTSFGPVLAGQLVRLDGRNSTDPGTLDNLTYDWEFTSNTGQQISPSGSSTVEFRPTFAGFYNVRLTVTDPAGETSSILDVVSVNPQPPVLTSRTGLEGTVFVFDAVGGSEPAATAVRTWSWKVTATGVPEITGSGETFAFVPTDNGTYTVELTITDTIGASAFLSKTTATVTVSNAAPTAQFGGDSFGVEGSQITLTPVIHDPGSADTFTYAWTITDQNNQSVTPETPANGSTISFTPADNGVYTVSLTVTDDDGDASTTTTQVIATNRHPDVAAGADQTVNEGASSNQITFSGSFTDAGGNADGLFSWTWDFGDGTTASGTSTGSLPAVVHQYADSGSWTVTLTVT
ncbi:MAG: PKD domain-containing protein, partial [Planctomycetaceae bacterium]|nr:PKD domain-containing protein [Planctomycetaceae bacterium]